MPSRPGPVRRRTSAHIIPRRSRRLYGRRRPAPGSPVGDLDGPCLMSMREAAQPVLRVLGPVQGLFQDDRMVMLLAPSVRAAPWRSRWAIRRASLPHSTDGGLLSTCLLFILIVAVASWRARIGGIQHPALPALISVTRYWWCSAPRRRRPRCLADAEAGAFGVRPAGGRPGDSHRIFVQSGRHQHLPDDGGGVRRTGFEHRSHAVARTAILAVAMLTSRAPRASPERGFITLAATLMVVPSVPVAGLALILGIDRFMSEARALTTSSATVLRPRDRALGGRVGRPRLDAELAAAGSSATLLGDTAADFGD